MARHSVAPRSPHERASGDPLRGTGVGGLRESPDLPRELTHRSQAPPKCHLHKKPNAKCKFCQKAELHSAARAAASVVGSAAASGSGDGGGADRAAGSGAGGERGGHAGAGVCAGGVSPGMLRSIGGPAGPERESLGTLADLRLPTRRLDVEAATVAQ